MYSTTQLHSYTVHENSNVGQVLCPLQVIPSELDDLLLGHPSVADVAVVGIPDVDAGEVPYAWVVLKPGQSITEKELVSWVSGKKKCAHCTTFIAYIRITIIKVFK